MSVRNTWANTQSPPPKKRVPMLVPWKISVPFIKLQLSNMCNRSFLLTVNLCCVGKVSGIWMISVSICLLVHSRHQKSMSVYSIQESNLHIYYCTARKPRGKSLSGEWEGSAPCGGDGTLRTAINWIFQNMQSTVRWCNIDHKCFGTTTVIGIKTKQRKQFGDKFLK